MRRTETVGKISKAAIVTGLTLPFFASANPESWYVEQSCQGEIEVTLPDRSRVDCLTDTHAIEYDFTNKGLEAIGQALHYARMTGKKAGIVLIGSQDDPGFKRVMGVKQGYDLPIEVNTLSK